MNAPGLPRFTVDLGISTGLVLLLAATFALYVRAEHRVDAAQSLRYRSYQLADELRQSGDDLTRMVRTCVVTGDPVYKRRFQHILDIRDGRRPRPDAYALPYWDLVLGEGPPPRASGAATALLVLMQDAGFTAAEFELLATAKSNSDALTQPELEAMRLVEATGPDADANRARATAMLYDANYHRAKAAVMQPIADFFALVDRRTLATVRAAERHATLLRGVFVAVGLALAYMLWRTYAALRTTLGGSLGELHAQIVRIGSGDFSPAPEPGPQMGNSVLGWLAATRAQLQQHDQARGRQDAALRAEVAERQQAEAALATRVEELAEFNAVAVDRELRMIELKQEINLLADRLGRPRPYPLADAIEAERGDSSRAIPDGAAEPACARGDGA